MYVICTLLRPKVGSIARTIDGRSIAGLGGLRTLPLKFDYPPLLAPGRHTMSLQEIEALCVQPFGGTSRARREKLFYALEDVVQVLLASHIRCDVFVDGSFFTEKPEPADVDVIVAMDFSAFDALDEAQHQVIEALNTTQNSLVDSLAVTTFPHDHPYRGYGLDGESMIDGYGLEHSEVYLKGYAVLKVWETDVGNRICR
jgi:hypothetical protein